MSTKKVHLPKPTLNKPVLWLLAALALALIIRDPIGSAAVVRNLFDAVGIAFQHTGGGR